jgi:hypothetical protein
MFCRTYEFRGSKLEYVDDGVGTHRYLLCTILGCGDAFSL